MGGREREREKRKDLIELTFTFLGAEEARLSAITAAAAAAQLASKGTSILEFPEINDEKCDSK